MAQSAYLATVAIQDSALLDAPRHSALVRITHWINAASFIALDHGAPLRLRIPRQLGYKSVKYLSRITLTDSLKHVGDGRGSAQPGYGYSWFAGI
jgi:DMSO/TMAO reductase YedYZ molybdopterin-dependent catalytic subunit